MLETYFVLSKITFKIQNTEWTLYANTHFTKLVQAIFIIQANIKVAYKYLFFILYYIIVCSYLTKINFNRIEMLFSVFKCLS